MLSVAINGNNTIGEYSYHKQANPTLILYIKLSLTINAAHAENRGMKVVSVSMFLNVNFRDKL
jgi:hypothetical protein